MVGCECRENKGCGGNGETVDGDRTNKTHGVFLTKLLGERDASTECKLTVYISRIALTAVKAVKALIHCQCIQLINQFPRYSYVYSTSQIHSPCFDSPYQLGWICPYIEVGVVVQFPTC